MHSFRPLHLLMASLLAIPAAAAQGTINPTERYAHFANAGWIDFRPSSIDGVIVGEGHLSGNAYAANLGWIRLGNGNPANGHAYGNGSATDFGINLDRHGNLTGYAYSANAGWVNFGWATAADPKRPRINLRTGTFHGYAYGSNIGWLKLDADTLRTDSLQVVDLDDDGIGDLWEIAKFGDLDIATSESNFDHDRASDLADDLAGTDPKNSGDFLCIVEAVIDRGEATVTLEFTTNESRRYRIDWSDNLDTWHPVSELGEFDPDPGSITTRTFTLLAREKTFWQVTSIRPLATNP